MKLFLSSILWCCICLPLFAKDAPMTDGRSPDGRYEVRIFQEPDSGGGLDYTVHICSVMPQVTSTYEVPDVGGYLRYDTAVERDRALWDPSSQFVAITDQGTRHSRELYLYALRDGKFERLSLPGYIDNALGRAHATEVNRTCVSTLKHWAGDDLIIELTFDAPGYSTHTCEVVLHVSHGENQASRVGLKSIGDLREGSG